MILDTRIIPDGFSEQNQAVTLDAFGDDLEIFAPEPVACRATINRVDENLYVHLFYSGKITQQCARCLNDFQHEVSGDFRASVSPEAKKSEIADEDALNATYYYTEEEPVADISRGVGEDIVINLPLKPLCAKDCGGIKIASSDTISAEFGENSPTDKKIDPRWEALRKLKKD